MTRRRPWTLSLGPLLIAAVVLLVGFGSAGIAVRGYVADAFRQSQRLEDARLLAGRTLMLQVDEETGIRGFTVTGDRRFLEPYHRARVGSGAVFSRLNDALAKSGAGGVASAGLDIAATNDRWYREIAVPSLANPGAATTRMELRGKNLVDHIRNQVAFVQSRLRDRESVVVVHAQSAVDRINIFVGLVTFVLLLVMVSYFVQLRRIQAREEAARLVADQERRQRENLAAALETERRIADTLQEAFTQRPLPSLETLHFSASYVPATEDTRVGGDWYDAMALAPNRVLFAIGDVTGHGIEAAVTMNRARQSLLASALLDPNPAAVLGRVNAEILSLETRLVTAIVGVADAATYEFSYAVAGHPPPVLIEPGRSPRMLECGSLPLGTIAGTSYAVRRVQSVPGALLVLYTDGAVEHSRNVIEGEALLLRAIDDARDHAEQNFATYVHDAIFAGRSVGDDVAILTVGFAASTAGLVVSADRAQKAAQWGRVELDGSRIESDVPRARLRIAS